MTRLQEIRERCEKATPGPWHVLVGDLDGDEYCDGISTEREGHDDIVKTDSGVYPPSLADASFIASAREDVPFLLAEVERLEKELFESEFALNTTDAFSKAQFERNDEYRLAMTMAGGQLIELRSDNERLRALVKSVETVGGGGSLVMSSSCPFCSAHSDEYDKD